MSRAATSVEPPAGVRFGRVIGSTRAGLIVATGPSADGVPDELVVAAAAAGVHVVAVKRAVLWAPVVHAWVTVDAGARARDLMLHPRAGVAYHAAVPDEYGTPRAPAPIQRLPPPKGVVWLRRRPGPPALSEDPGVLRSGNSAFGALGYLVLMGARAVAMIGVDGTQAAFARDGVRRPNGSLAHLPVLFESAVPQLKRLGVEVVNGSPSSRVRVFRRTGPAAALRWIAQRAAELGEAPAETAGWMA